VEEVQKLDVMAAVHEQSPSVMYKTTANLNVRKNCGLEFEIVRILPLGTRIEGKPAEEGWVAVEDGFCMEKFLEKI